MYYNPIEKIHIELTNRCNAACPSCPRTGKYKGNLAKHMVTAGWYDISLEDIKKMCSNPVLSKLRKVHLCGNFGDPAVAPDFFEIVEYFIRKKINVTISTNGHPGKAEDWVRLANEYVRIFWHIDGDEETNHLYRVGTNFKKIITNSRAFINAGGKAEWVFIPFLHNEHVIDKCKNLADKYRFDAFRIKKSYSVGDNNSNRQKDIQLPKDKNLIAPIVTDKTEKQIICRSLKINEFYLACDGDVFPCCWWGTYFWKEKYDSFENKFKYLIDFNNNIHESNIAKILHNFKEKKDIYELVWENRAFKVCNKSCGSTEWNSRYID